MTINADGNMKTNKQSQKSRFTPKGRLIFSTTKVLSLAVKNLKLAPL
jgi:hypothetical protein